MIRWVAVGLFLTMALPLFADPVRIQWVALCDVHGLWGGVNVYVDEEGYVFAQVVGVTGIEKRYSGQMKPANIPEFERMLEETDFLHIKLPERRGAPDESRPQVRILLKSGAEFVIEKWAGDKHEGFDRVYKWFLQRSETLKTGKPLYEGRYDANWRPDKYR